MQELTKICIDRVIFETTDPQRECCLYGKQVDTNHIFGTMCPYNVTAYANAQPGISILLFKINNRVSTPLRHFLTIAFMIFFFLFIMQIAAIV
jgi:hypothetical protein